MTIQSAKAELAMAVEDAWAAVAELVLITLEDQPEEGALAAVDDLTEQVVELQGELAAVRSALRARATAETLPAVQAGLDAVVWRYWRRVRAHGPIAQLRAATRRLGGSWPDWQHGVEQTALRCEDPFGVAAAASRAWCREVCQLLIPVGGPAGPPPDQLRRTS